MSSERPTIAGIEATCWNCTTGEGAPPQRVTAIVVPSRIFASEDGSMRVNWSCSLGRACFFRPCVYAWGYRRSEAERDERQ